MKKISLNIPLVAVLLLLCVGTLIGQTADDLLEDTYWRLEAAVRPGNSILVHFTNDTIHVADDFEDDFNILDKYQVRNDTFYRQQLYSAGDCDTSLVGQYQVIQAGEIMRFEEIMDPCVGRGPDIEGLVYTRLAYTPHLDSTSHINNFSIAAHESLAGVFEYQNNSLLNERPDYKVYDVLGNEMDSDQLNTSGQILLRDYEDGTYYLSLLWFYGTETFQLFKLSTTSVIEPEMPAGYNIYPNPSPSGIFTYENQSDSFQAPYRIYSVTGKLLQSGELGARGEIDISDAANGVYYMMIEGRGRQEVLKLVR